MVNKMKTTMDERLQIVALERKVDKLNKIINDQFNKIQELNEENFEFKIACEEYKNLMRECIFDQ